MKHNDTSELLKICHYRIILHENEIKRSSHYGNFCVLV